LKNEKLTKAESLKTELRKLIRQKTAHKALPSERQLAEHYKVSRMTLRLVLGELQREGLIYRRRGKGTFTSEERVSKRMGLTSFTEDMKEKGLVAKNKVINAEVVAPPVQLIEAWGIEVPRVFRITRLRLGGSTPMCLEDAYLNIEAAPDLLAQDLSTSLYALFEEKYGRPIVIATHEVQAISLDLKTAQMLKVPKGSAALQFIQVGFDSANRPVEYCISIKRADKFDLRYTVQTG
jgi:GntR family transcriptional regulator